MQAWFDSLETRIASKLVRRKAAGWICPSCLRNLRTARQFQTQRHLRQDAQEQAATRRKKADIQRYNPSRGTSLRELASTEQWIDAYRQSRQPLQEVAALGLEDSGDLAKGLNLKDSNLVFKALLENQDDPEYFAAITASTWTEIWRVLNPQKVFPALHRIHRSLNLETLEGLPRRAFNYQKTRDRYMKDIADLVDIRRRHGPSMDIVDYRTLLTFVGRIGDEAGARMIWADMKMDGLRPDRDCYNRFMEAIVWDEAARQRQTRKAKDTVDRLRPQFTDIVLFKPGKSVEITNLFNEMATHKIAPDTATMCVLMTAMARDGEFTEATKILKRVWTVDVHALLNGDAVKKSHLKRIYEPSAPLFPTWRLFSTIAEVYGQANEIPAGLRILDYIAAQYDVRLPEHVWYQVVRWAWLQARLKPHERRIGPPGTQINIETVDRLVQILSSERYLVEASMDLHDLSFNTLMDSPYAFDHRFQQSRFLDIFKAGRRKLATSENMLRRLVARARDSTALRKSGGVSATYSADKIRVEHAHFNYRTQQALLSRWMKKIVSLPRSKLGKEDHILRARDNGVNPQDWRSQGLANLTEWRLRGFQNFLWEYRAIIPSIMRYTTDTGIVTLQVRNVERELKAKVDKQSVVKEKKRVAVLRLGRRTSGSRTYNSSLGSQVRRVRRRKRMESSRPPVEEM